MLKIVSILRVKLDVHMEDIIGNVMRINERDIFDYVFYPDNLSNEKVEYLKTSKIFDEEIEFYLALKNELGKKLPDEIKLKIAEKIPIYNPIKYHVLYPADEPQKKRKNDYLILAAATPKETPSVTSKTFIDEANHYLIRLLNFRKSAKIYVFSTTEEVLKDYKIVLQPSGKVFHQADNVNPIETDEPVEAENIELQFN